MVDRFVQIFHILCLFALSVTEKGVIKFPTRIVDSFVSPFSSVRFASCILKLCYWVHLGLCLLRIDLCIIMKGPSLSLAILFILKSRLSNSYAPFQLRKGKRQESVYDSAAGLTYLKSKIVCVFSTPSLGA